MPLSPTADPTATNFMIGDQVLEDGKTVDVWAEFPDGTWHLASADIEISDGVLTLTFAPELRVQEVDLPAGSARPFQVRLPQHSDDAFPLNLKVTAPANVVTGELDTTHKKAPPPAVLNINKQKSTVTGS